MRLCENKNMIELGRKYEYDGGRRSWRTLGIEEPHETFRRSYNARPGSHIYTACEFPGFGRCGPCDTQPGGKARMCIRCQPRQAPAKASQMRGVASGCSKEQQGNTISARSDPLGCRLLLGYPIQSRHQVRRAFLQK